MTDRENLGADKGLPAPGSGAPSREPREAFIERVVYGGLGLTRGLRQGASADDGAAFFVPYTLPGETVEASPVGSGDEWRLRRVLEPSPERVAAPCPYFGICGGCQLQMGSYPEQLRIKSAVLRESLERAGVRQIPAITVHAAAPLGYRNRIRLHVTESGGLLRLGYREHANPQAILPIHTCPIAAPVLPRAAEALLQLSENNTSAAAWLRGAAEVELACTDAERDVGITLLSPRASAWPRPATLDGVFSALRTALGSGGSTLRGLAALHVAERGGRVLATVAEAGAGGLAYEVNALDAVERFWVARGGFFQINRFLLSTLVELVGAGAEGRLAWDLFAGVGLFSRVLARRFGQVVAVEANPLAAAELRAGLLRIGSAHMGVQAVVGDWLRAQRLQRERPEFVVLDPPRAGVGAEACRLLAAMGPATIVYVSCDPVTLGRDLAVLEAAGYRLDELHLVDLFPQTYHQEAVVRLHRSG